VKTWLLALLIAVSTVSAYHYPYVIEYERPDYRETYYSSPQGSSYSQTIYDGDNFYKYRQYENYGNSRGCIGSGCGYFGNSYNGYYGGYNNYGGCQSYYCRSDWNHNYNAITHSQVVPRYVWY
jgi:hypothetical protein